MITSNAKEHSLHQDVTQATSLQDKKVLLAVTGGIAVYKAVEVLRGLQKAGCDVRVVATVDALRFVGKPTFEALSGHPVAHDVFVNEESYIPHIDLSAWADVVCVVPATANVLAKMATGLADDMLSTTLLAVPQQTPVFIAPAMNVHMWQHPATQRNVQQLKADGKIFIAPVSGRLACGDVGDGKLASVETIVAALLDGFVLQRPVDKTLAGMHFLITAGPTHEAIDPVRYLANSSSGKMGYAIAREATARGAQVTLVSGPVQLSELAGVTTVHVVSAQEMYDATMEAFTSCDVAIFAAAVADYTPAHPADHKLKKGIETLDKLELVKTKDILAAASACKGNRLVIGFAAETNQVKQYAQAKLASKGCDLIVANDVSRQDSGFGSNTNRVSFVSAAGVEQLDTLPKEQVATCLLNKVEDLITQRRAQASTCTCSSKDISTKQE